MLAHHRAEAYPAARRAIYPAARPADALTVAGNDKAIAAAKARRAASS